jgi:hypothetical protein
MKYGSKWLCLGVIVLISTACSYLKPVDRNAEMVSFGPDQPQSLVVYFRLGTTEEQVEAFQYEVLSESGSNGKSQAIGSYIRLAPSQAHGHWGFAITFLKKISEQQRSAIKESIKSHQLVYRVFEGIAPNDIKDAESPPNAPTQW